MIDTAYFLLKYCKFTDENKQVHTQMKYRDTNNLILESLEHELSAALLSSGHGGVAQLYSAC